MKTETETKTALDVLVEMHKDSIIKAIKTDSQGLNVLELKQLINWKGDRATLNQILEVMEKENEIFFSANCLIQIQKKREHRVLFLREQENERAYDMNFHLKQQDEAEIARYNRVKQFNQEEN